MSMVLCKLKKISIGDLRVMINRGRVYLQFGGRIGMLQVTNPERVENTHRLIQFDKVYVRTDGL